MKQKTIRKSIECFGIGLHRGGKVRLCFRPAPEDSGIIFLLKTDNGDIRFTPTPESVVSTMLATTLSNGAAAVATVEHMLAAVRGLGIDNILIEVEGGEVPIMDGSAASFAFLLRSVGIIEQNKGKRVFLLTEEISYEQDGKWVKARPYSGVKIDFTIDYPHPLIGRQQMSFELSSENFLQQVAKARTFGFVKDVEMLQQNGLALGGSLDNAVVLDEYAVVNSEGLRFQDEFVRHKVLDFIGDMALLERPLFAHFDVFCSGHTVNNAFLRKVSAERDKYLKPAELPAPAPQHAPEPAFAPAAAAAVP